MQLAVSTSQNHTMLRRRKNVWYSVKDGNWSDPNTWMSNALDRKLITMPQTGDDVHVCHNVIIDTTIAINNLYVSGTLKDSNILNVIITVNGDLQAEGALNFGVNNSNVSIVLNGYNNFINGFASGTSSTIIYGGYYNQNVLNLAYANLITQGFGNKFLTANTTLTGNLSVYNLECLSYNLTVNGTTTVPNENTGKFSKSGSGNLLFIGQFGFGENSTIDWSAGNPSIEFRGGFNFNSYTFNTGTGTVKFTTNNQNIRCGANVSGNWNAPILISGAITITNLSNSNLNSFSTINGDNVSSTLNNDGTITLNNTTVPMATGIFNYMHGSSSTMVYNMTSSYVLPYTTYINLTTALAGTKSLGGTTTITGNLKVLSNFDCAAYDLTVNGTTDVNNGADGSAFKKTGSGSLLFIGQFGLGNNNGIDWSGGNPNVEFRGGFNLNAYFFNTGTGTFKFTTNNQNIRITANNTGAFVAPMLISGAITVTNINNNATFLFPTTGLINGDNSGSIFINNGYLNYQNSAAPMATGKLYCNQATNTFIYGASGNQDIQTPSDPTSPGYKNLTLQGPGVKTLLGNISIKGVYTLTSPATLNSNGFSLTNS